MSWIGDPAVAVSEGQLHRLGHQVIIIRRSFANLCHVVFLKDIEDHQGRDTLGVWRQLGDLIPVILGADRFDPIRNVAREVIHIEYAARCAQSPGDPFRQFSTVETIHAFLGNYRQAARQVWLAQNAAGPGRFAAGEVDARCAFVWLQCAPVAGDKICELFG